MARQEARLAANEPELAPLIRGAGLAEGIDYPQTIDDLYVQRVLGIEPRTPAPAPRRRWPRIGAARVDSFRAPRHCFNDRGLVSMHEGAA